MKTRYVLSCLLLGSALSVSAQKTAVKSNLLSAANGALNAGVEYAFGPKSTFDLSGSIRPWKRTEGYVNKYWLIQRNGCMDHRNTPTDSVSTCYLPFMQESANLEDIQVVHAGMNTLRLMENDDTRLRLIHQPDGKEIFDIPLTPYLLLSRNVETTYMPPQEYLDRQDRYNLIFFLSPTEDPQKPYICLQMQVNGWIIRINDAELDK